MPLQSYTGTFNSPNGTDATFSVTGVGFEPKLVIFLPTNRTSTGADATSDVSMGIGAMTATGQFYAGFGVTDAGASSSVGWVRHTSHCIIVSIDNTTSIETAAFVSMDSDGFTIDYAQSDSTQRAVMFQCYGGGNCDFEVGTFTLTTAVTGTKAVTTAFQPKGYLIVDANITSFGLTEEAGVGDVAFTFGGATGATEEVVVSTFDEDGQARTDTGRGLSTTAVIQQQDAGTSIDCSAEHSSFNATDFTINVTTAPASTNAFCFIAFGGSSLDCFAGNFVHSTSVATQAVTVETGFTPQSIIFASTDQATVGTSNDAVLNLGLATGVSTTDDIQGYTFAEDDNNANAVPVTNLDNADILSEITHSTGAESAAFNVDSLDANGFTIGWTTQASVANIQGYFALRNLPSPTLLDIPRRRRMSAHLAR